MKKKILFACIVFLLMAAFVLIPAPASNLYIRIYFDEIQGDSCALYYAVDGDEAFSQEQCVSSVIDYDKQMVEFVLEPSLEGRITGLRLDFPAEPQLLCVKTITVSNAGVIKREYNPCDFFAGENILYSNDIDAISLVTARARTYVKTFSDDPFMLLSGELCQQLMGCYSHFRLTKLAVCVFLSASFFLAKMKIWRD
ncbi:MAG: hypothetical protein K2J60_00895 [Acetatifactor sp.]|nr:hypothetical protein [Acetatifactor sp.]